MPLPIVPPGPMSFSQINTELGLTSTATISLNDAAVRTLAGVGASPATIAITDLSGKANAITGTWTQKTNYKVGTLGLNRFNMASGNGRYAVLASSIYTTDDNGATWQTRSPPGGYTSWRSIAFGNGMWVCIGALQTGVYYAAYSGDNMATWTLVPLSGISLSNDFYSILYANGWFVAPSVICARSSDGVTWNTTASSAVGTPTKLATNGAGTWLVQKSGNTFAYSTDNGATWATTVISFPSGSMSDIAYGNGVWLLVAVSGATSYVYQSTSVNSGWTLRNTYTGTIAACLNGSIGFLRNRFFTTVTASGAAISTDGVTWTASTSPTWTTGSKALGIGTSNAMTVCSDTRSAYLS